MRHAVPRRRAWIAALLGFLALSFLALGAAWSLARVQPREEPRWDEDGFVALREAPGSPDVWTERWVVAVHPGCPHCRVSLESLTAVRDRSAARVRITALIVDTEAAPPDSIVTRLPADEARWDSAGRWRQRWGHRVYGEVCCFDTEGRLRRTLPPLADQDEAARRLAAHGLTGRPN